MSVHWKVNNITFRSWRPDAQINEQNRHFQRLVESISKWHAPESASKTFRRKSTKKFTILLFSTKTEIPSWNILKN